MKSSLVIPCFNEAANLPMLIDKCNKIIALDSRIEIILVDNGSTDSTSLILKEHCHGNLKYLKIPTNKGYGHGICMGLKNATGDYLGWTHADLQTDPVDFIKAIQLLYLNQPDSFVKGYRRGRSFFDVFFTVGMSIFESILLCKKINDINAQPTVFSRSFFEKWESPPDDFSLDLYAFWMAHKHKQNIIRFDVIFPPRMHGTSNWNFSFKSKLKFIKRTIDFSLRLRINGAK